MTDESWPDIIRDTNFFKRKVFVKFDCLQFNLNRKQEYFKTVSSDTGSDSDTFIDFL